MANDKISICSRASVLVGGSPIEAFTSSSAEEIIAEQLYDATVATILASYRWRFASQYVELARHAEAPLVQWEAAYALPAGTTVIYGIYVNDVPIEFDRVGQDVLCNAGADELVVGLVGFIPNEDLFPPYFRSCLELKLASLFAVPIAEDAQKASVYEGMFIRQFAQARSIESQGRTAPKLRLGKLRAFHRGRA